MLLFKLLALCTVVIPRFLTFNSINGLIGISNTRLVANQVVGWIILHRSVYYSVLQADTLSSFDSATQISVEWFFILHSARHRAVKLQFYNILITHIMCIMCNKIHTKIYIIASMFSTKPISLGRSHFTLDSQQVAPVCTEFKWKYNLMFDCQSSIYMPSLRLSLVFPCRRTKEGCL